MAGLMADYFRRDPFASLNPVSRKLDTGFDGLSINLKRPSNVRFDLMTTVDRNYDETELPWITQERRRILENGEEDRQLSNVESIVVDGKGASIGLSPILSSEIAFVRRGEEWVNRERVTALGIRPLQVAIIVESSDNQQLLTTSGLAYAHTFRDFVELDVRAKTDPLERFVRGWVTNEFGIGGSLVTGVNFHSFERQFDKELPVFVAKGIVMINLRAKEIESCSCSSFSVINLGRSQDPSKAPHTCDF